MYRYLICSRHTNNRKALAKHQTTFNSRTKQAMTFSVMRESACSKTPNSASCTLRVRKHVAKLKQESAGRRPTKIVKVEHVTL